MERIAFVFPGQGSQSVGMAGDLYENSSAVREVYERASEAIDVDLSDVPDVLDELREKADAFDEIKEEEMEEDEDSTIPQKREENPETRNDSA